MPNKRWVMHVLYRVLFLRAQLHCIILGRHLAFCPYASAHHWHAHAGALNFKDVMLAYGKLSREALAHEGGAPSIGFEFSGMVSLHSLSAVHLDVQSGLMTCRG